jgi:putative membrane protein
MEHTHHVVSQSYGVLLVLVLAATLYGRGWPRVRSTFPEVCPAWRAGSFLVGLILVWVAVASPAVGFVHEVLTAHMVQHLLLMTIAAPLIWIGEPLMPIMHGLPRSVVRLIVVPLLRSPVMQRLGKIMARPSVCWFGAAATLVGWHIPALFALGMKSATWHGIEQASFLVTGLLFWWPVAQPWPNVKRPEWSMIIYLFLATLPCDILSGFLVFCDRVVYPVYLSTPRMFGVSALEDQQCAGALMWTVVTVIYLVAGATITARLLSPQKSQDGWKTAPQTSRRSAEVA